MNEFLIGFFTGSAVLGVAAFFLYKYAYKNGAKDVLHKRREKGLKLLKKKKQHEEKLRQMDDDEFWDYVSRNSGGM